MVEHDSREDVALFRALPLEEKMVKYEQGLVTHSLKLNMLFQELIDDGRCWGESFPNHTHYARMCASYLRKTTCHLHNAFVQPPDEAILPDYLYQSIYEGYDAWGRTPMDPDWGRWLRWQERREMLIEDFKNKQERKKQGLPIPPPSSHKRRGCCGK